MGLETPRKRFVMTNKEKYRQIQKEAAATGLTLVLLMIYWFVGGFGLMDSEVRLAGLPLWVVAGVPGTWLMAIILVKLLTSFVFKDMPLDDLTENKAAKDGEVANHG